MGLTSATERLVAEHRRWLGYLERQLGDRALAEDVLQEAFVKTAGKVPEIEGEALVAWFRRVLKNAAIDVRRRDGARARMLDAFAHEPERAGDELAHEVCRCVLAVGEQLKPEYRDALRRIEIDGLAVKDFAEEAGITAQNAGVRVHRARRALAEALTQACGTCAVHGCFDCQCRAR